MVKKKRLRRRKWLVYLHDVIFFFAIVLAIPSILLFLLAWQVSKRIIVRNMKP